MFLNLIRGLPIIVSVGVGSGGGGRLETSMRHGKLNLFSVASWQYTYNARH